MQELIIFSVEQKKKPKKKEIKMQCQSARSARIKYMQKKFTDFFSQRLLPMQIEIKVWIAWDAQQWQCAVLCWTIWCGIRCYILNRCISWRLIRRKISGLMKWRCLFTFPPGYYCGLWSWCCRCRRRRWFCRYARQRRPRKVCCRLGSRRISGRR